MVADRVNDSEAEVVISGVGGAFPKARNIEEFKKALLSNETLLGTRWKEGQHGVSNKLGVISDIELFDSVFFSIHRQQASFMDPMQRVLMERTFEALVDAGVNPQEIRGKRIGVYTASSIGENDNLFYESVVSGFGVTGHSRAMMANRISYWLNLKGPSCAYDSNWNGGTEVLAMAADAVRTGQCDAAIIGSANITLNSEISWHYNDMGLLSADGSTRAFDTNASGYARGEGVIAMFIQRASEARRSYASVIHAATIFNGARDGPFTELSLSGMTDFIDKFYKKCGVDPGEVAYVETYGCAVKKTDEIELKAIESVYCKNRKKPLLIGSVKTQTGHTEASATLMSITKVLIAFDSGIIPAHIQLLHPNPNIPGLFNGNMEVVTRNLEWDADLAAVHGIGLASSYSHLLLKRNPKKKHVVDNDLPKLVVASDRHEAGIREVLQTVQNQPTFDPEYIALIHELYSKTLSGHLYRGYTILSKSDDIKQEEVTRYPGNKRPIWFIYSGMGSQWPRMACDLMNLPIFAESIMRSHKILQKRGIDLLNIITTDDKTIFDNILHSFVGIAAVQIALTDILKAAGIKPDGIIGHSVGELGCAYADDCLTAEQMILCSYSRGRASLEADLIPGMMAAVGLGYNQIKDDVPPTIEVACHNASDSCTLSGPTEDLAVYVKSLESKGIFARLVNVSNIAYHSKYIKPAAPGLLKYLREIVPNPKRRSAKWICTSQLEENWNNDVTHFSSAEYHTNNLLNSVYFEEGSKHIPKDAIAIEIAPHGLLQAILRRSLTGEITNIPLTLRVSKEPLKFLLGALGKIYLTGIDVNLAAIYPPVGYPVSRSTMSLAPLVHWEHSDHWRTGIEDKLNYLVSMKNIQISLNSEEFKQYAGHELDNNIVIPVSAYLGILLDIFAIRVSGDLNDIVFDRLSLKNTLIIPRAGSVPLSAVIQKGTGSFEILSGDTILCTGIVRIPEPTDIIMSNVPESEATEMSVHLSAEDIYNEFVHRGHKYHGNFKLIKNLELNETGSKSIISWENKWQSLIESMLQLVILKHGEKHQNVLVPLFIRKIVLSLKKLPVERKDLLVTYDYYTRIVSTEGIQIVNAETTELKQSTLPLSYFSLEFIPFNDVEYENIECAINNCIQLALENFEDPLIGSIIIIETTTKNSSLMQNIKNVTDKNIHIRAKFATDNKIAMLSHSNPVLIVSNQEVDEDLATTVQSSNAFALVRSSKDILGYPKIVQVLQFLVGGISYSLLRKASNSSVFMVKIPGNSLSIQDLSTTSLSWVAELNNHLLSGSSDTVVLVSHSLPNEGVINFAQALRAIPEYKSVRTLFLLDQMTSEFNPKENIFHNVFEKDLITCVQKNGVFGTYVSVPIDYINNIKLSTDSGNTLIANNDVEFIGVNVNDETMFVEKCEVGLGNIDYAGTNNQQQRIMGLAEFDSENFKLVPDPILSWDIPKRWTMDGGCTVPHAYVTAYSCLVLKARLAHGETVLIHNGCSAISLASIAVAISYGCNVFVTASTDEQRYYLKKTFPNKLRDRNVLNSRTTSFEPHLLLATGGVGAHVILNCLSKSLLKASIRCLADGGRFVQLGKYDMKQKSSIGMSVFVKNTSMVGVIPEEIFSAPIEDKRKLHALIQEGIHSNVVRPIKAVIVDHQNINGVIESLKKCETIGKILIKVTPTLAVNSFNVRKPNQYICEAAGSYLVYGGTADIWADMVEWLVKRGARKIVVASDTDTQQGYINRRLNLLRNNFNATIVRKSDTSQTKDGANKLLSEVYSLGTIQTVFILPNKNNITNAESIYNIDAALRIIAPKVLFVNLVSGAAGIAQHRSQAGYPTYIIEWPEEMNFNIALHGLDEIFTLNTSSVIIKSWKEEGGQETTQALYKKLVLLLPHSAEELLEQLKSSSQKPTFKQVSTSGPVKIREVPPIFIIPGLFSHSNIVEMCRGLLHPTFVAQLPMSKMSLKAIAAFLAEEMRAIFPDGPYNIIGISWGGVLSIEIAKLLQKHGKVQLTFVDGAPDTIKSIISHLGNNVNIEVNILSRMLNISAAEVLKKLKSLPDWNSRLSLAVTTYQEHKEDLSLLETALDVLLHRVNAVVNFSSDEQLIKGEVFLVRPSGSSKYDDCNLSKYFQQEAQIHLVNGDHISMLHHQEFVDVINDNVTCSN